jgi:AraC-like DNA-binding protein
MNNMPGVQLNNYDIECLGKVKELVAADLAVRHTIPQLAAVAGMGLTRFREAFKIHTGFNVFQYIHLQRMNKAYALVTENYHPVKTIAQQCGYRYAAHFNTAFKKHFGISPKKIRSAK